MIEVRWHGRGGQGVVTSSQLLSQAAIHEGKYAIHIPEFGPERRGAPVRSYTRIDDNEIEIRYGVLHPDIVVVIDPTLATYKDMILDGIKKDATIILNSPGGDVPEEYYNFNLYLVDAYRIALDTLGRAIYNTSMLGALVGATGIVSLESVLKVMEARFSGQVLHKNIEAVRRGAKEVKKVG